MFPVLRRAALVLGLSLLAACASPHVDEAKASQSEIHRGETPEIHALINKAARDYGVPAALIRRVVERESSYNPAARNGRYYGLMQILPGTAHTMGYNGPDRGLLDASTNLTYGVKYLRGAWLLSHGNYDTAMMWYARGYYYEARRRGMLAQVGMH
ncbi:MAG: lytic transglycosylase domain-containing protein [Paracoccaceae bacterium]|nr:lytic transglycosylase domain-containing protein [Paracoccaceae bacterium]